MHEEATWHDVEVEEVISRLKADLGGLTEEEVGRRLEQYGPNEIGGEKGISKLRLLAAQVKNPLNAVLAAAAIISFIA